MTTDGFLSGVLDDRHPHRGEIVVRAREASALEALRDVAPALSEISVTSDTDYRYRGWLSVEEWAQALAELGRRVDYSNFKSEVLRVQGRSLYEGALHTVWGVLGRTQPRGPYGWGGKGYPRVPKGERAKRRGGGLTAPSRLSHQPTTRPTRLPAALPSGPGDPT